MKQLHAIVTALFFAVGFVSVYVAAQPAFQPFQVQDIRVEGNQRVSQGTIFEAMPIQLGDVVTPGILSDAADALIRTGYFDDIQFGRDDNVLVVEVVERPAIAKITVDGNKAIKTEDLLKNMSDNGLAEGQIFQQAVLDGMSSAIRKSYIDQGRYNADIKTEIIELPRNQVELNILIDEGKEARIKHINILGNEIFSDEDLLELFELTTSGLFTWMNGRDKISSEKLSGDLERLESFYLDRGYLDFRILSAPVSISPDKETFYITINLTEGEVYTVDEIKLSGDLILSEEAIRSLVMLRSGQLFSQSLMTSTSEVIKQILANQGYTFAEAQGITELNPDDKTVDVTFHIDPGKRAYVRRVDFRGNTKTADEVLRREMLQMEGGYASSRDIENSVVQLERTGFFKEADVEIKEVPGSEDLVDIEYTVEEQPSGAISFTVGYSQDFGASIGTSISDNNWFGTGKQIGFGINYSHYQADYRFNYNDPYFTPDGVNRGFSVFYTEFDYADYGGSDYSTNQYGASVSLGYPLSNIERINFSFGYTHTEILANEYSVQEISSTPVLIPWVANQYVSDTYLISQEWQNVVSSITSPQFIVDPDDSTQVIPNPDYDNFPLTSITGLNPLSFVPGDPVDPNTYDGFIDLNGDQFDMFTLTLTWLQTTLNRGASGLSNRGYQQQASLQVALPGGDLEYFKFIYTGQYFRPLTQSLTLRLKTRLGYVGSFGATEDVPFFEHFYAGGFGSVRGFERNTLGPRSTPPLYYASSLNALAPLASDIALVMPIDSDGDGNVDSFGPPPLSPTVGSADNVSYILCETFCGGSSAGYLSNRPLYVDPNPDPFGGNALVEGSIEVLFPLPFIKDQRSVQSAFFIDAGSVFDTDCRSTQLNCFDIGWEGMSASYGIGVTWISGFGPLTFSISRPIQEQRFDEVEFFQFSMGTSF